MSGVVCAELVCPAPSRVILIFAPWPVPIAETDQEQATKTEAHARRWHNTRSVSTEPAP